MAIGLAGTLAAHGTKNVAVLDFTDIQGQPTELGRFLSEQLVVELVLASGVSVLDRANFKSILAEHKLTAEGLVNPTNAKRLGEFAGVDTILIGTIATLDASFVVTVKAISTESSKIVAAGRITFAKTSELQWIGNRELSSPATAEISTTGGGPADLSLVTKDLGSLRVVLKSVLPAKAAGRDGRADDRVRCVLELHNLEVRRPLVVALNAEAGVVDGGWQSGVSPQDVPLRASLLDDRGGAWTALGSEMTGIGFVRAGVHGRNGREAYSPSEIARLLRLRDELGRDTDDPSDGTSVAEGGQNYSWGPGSVPPQPRFYPFRGNRFISGSTVPIDPGRSITVTMHFRRGARSSAPGAPPGRVHLNAEVVVGVVKSAKNTSYSLHAFEASGIRVPPS